MVRLPVPADPTVSVPVFAHIVPAPSTTTVPFDPASRPTAPSREVTTAPPEIVTDDVPLSPTTNRPVFAAAEVAVTVVPAPVIVPFPVDPATPPKNTLPPGDVRSAPPDNEKVAVWA